MVNRHLNQHEIFMRTALELSKKALPLCLPNPPVGCVLVKGNHVIAQGYTREPGSFHAEADAMSQVEGELSNVTAYVTLEPCSFHGRTPSCAQTLAERKVSRIVVAMVDPHIKNRGKGIEILMQAGVQVELGVYAEEVSSFIRPYLIDAN